MKEQRSDAVATWEILDPTSAGELRDERREFALDVLEGLSERPKRLSSRWFYDEEGSRVRESESFRVDAGSGERRLDLSGLPSGFYRAVLTGPSGDRAATTVVLLK